MKNIFVTGATGFIGGELVKRLLLQPENFLWLLIRQKRNRTAEQRLDAIMEQWSLSTGLPKIAIQQRVRLLEGDAEMPRLGLPQDIFNELSRKIDEIFHLAANIHFNVPLKQIRKSNLDGTNNILHLAENAVEHGGLERLHYVSTAYVAGQRKGLILEDELEAGQRFNNSYEKAKFEAELVVQCAKRRIPLTVYRPSIVMGHAQTGWTQTFNVLYGPMKMIYANKLPFIPLKLNAPFDVVPVNYIVDALCCLASRPETTGSTYHLTVGADRTIPVGDILKLTIENLKELMPRMGLHRRIANPTVVSPLAFIMLCKLRPLFGKTGIGKLLEASDTFAKYSYFDKYFDNTQALRILEPAGIVAPKMEEYFTTLIQFGLKQSFGLKKIAAAQAHHISKSPVLNNQEVIIEGSWL